MAKKLIPTASQTVVASRSIAYVSHTSLDLPIVLERSCLGHVACPEGIRTFQDAHPDVPIYTGAIDRQLDEHGYILPGLGDAGDRIFGTK